MRDPRLRLHLVSGRRNAERQVSKDKYQDASRKRLLSILQKKLTTSFIGALSKVETHIGRELWGHGKDVGECTPQQLAWRKVWEKCRNEILNNGNNQVRAVESEVFQYTVHWDRNQMVLPVKEKE